MDRARPGSWAHTDFATDFLVLPQHNWKWFLVRGLLATALGIVTILFPGFTLLTFAMLFAAYCFVDGVLTLIAGVRGAANHADKWWTLVLAGITGIAVGVLFAFWPMVATAAYTFLLVAVVAIWAFMTGVFEFSAAIRLRQATQDGTILAVAGGLSILLAVALFVFLVTSPQATLLSIAWIVGAYMLASGLVLIVLAFRLKGRRW